MEPLRILHVIPNLRRGGAERLAINIVAALNKLPDVTVKLLLLEEAIEYPELVKDLDIAITSSRFTPSILGKSVKELSHITALLNKFQPDIIHSHLFKADILVRCVTGGRVPVVTHFHDNMPQYRSFSGATLTSKSAFTNFYERRLIQSTWNRPGNRFIAISKHTEAYLQRALRQNRERVRLVYNAIDLERFYPTEQLKDISHKVKLINVGSFVPKKNQRFLIEVVEQLPGHYNLLFLGDGPDKKQLEKMVAHKDLAVRIQFGGMVHNPENYLREAAIYVHAATYEPFGLALVEAMATGLPVVALDGGGNRDIMQNGENGYMITNDDPEEFAQKIAQLAEDKSLYRKLQHGALQTAKRFGIEAYVDQLTQIYQEATAEAAALQIAEN